MDSWPSSRIRGVDADVGVGELGGKGVAQTVDEGATGAVGVDADTSKCPKHPGTAGCREST
jgi:hypothetical protein